MDTESALRGDHGAQLRALIVDDETALADLVASYLARERFTTRIATNGPEALMLAREFDPEVVVLDLGLPGIDGLEVCRQLRTFSDAYVVILTARDTETDTLAGLAAGADDYLTKPFSPRELVARVRALLRRPRTETVDQPGMPTQIAGLRIDAAAREVTLEGKPITLTPNEFDILSALSAHPGIVLSRRQLLEAIHRAPWFGDSHLIDVHIGHLRRKLGEDPTAPRYVITVRGVGYRLGSHPDAAERG